jgi:hypothetical protein
VAHTQAFTDPDDKSQRRRAGSVIATMLYLFTVASCLYVSVYFPGFEGADPRAVSPLVVASAVHAAFHQGHSIPGFWRNWLAICWAIGCTLVCTPHLFLTPPETQIVVQGSVMALAGAGLVFGAIKGVVMERALPMSTRVFYGAALIVTGVVLVAVGAPVTPRSEWAVTAFQPIVIGVALFMVTSAIVVRRPPR